MHVTSALAHSGSAATRCLPPEKRSPLQQINQLVLRCSVARDSHIDRYVLAAQNAQRSTISTPQQLSSNPKAVLPGQHDTSLSARSQNAPIATMFGSPRSGRAPTPEDAAGHPVQNATAIAPAISTPAILTRLRQTRQAVDAAAAVRIVAKGDRRDILGVSIFVAMPISGMNRSYIARMAIAADERQRHATVANAGQETCTDQYRQTTHFRVGYAANIDNARPVQAHTNNSIR